MALDMRETNYKKVGRRLAAVRLAMGMKQNEFARLIGVSEQNMNNYETGRSRPRVDIAFRICQKTGITLDWIYFGDPAGLPQRLTKLIFQEDGSLRA